MAKRFSVILADGMYTALQQWEWHFSDWARKIGAPYLEVRCPDRPQPFWVKASLGQGRELPQNNDELPVGRRTMMAKGLFIKAHSNADEPTAKSKSDQVTSLSSWGASTISPTASFEAILDFIKGKKAEGLIVTVTAMGTDKCLLVNDLQALDRGGQWTAQDWIGIDFKKLWRDSFHIGRHNYYGELVQKIERDHQINEFIYKIRRPSEALAEYSSNYFYIENFLQGPARIAVSRPGDWRIVEPSPNGSEV